MADYSNIALVDTDFARHSVNVNLRFETILKIYSVIASALDAELHVHPLVKDNEWECKDKNELYKLLENNALNYLTLKEHFGEKYDDKSRYYSRVVAELLSSILGLKYNEDDVLDKWETGSSFGEIHSLALCYVCGYGFFLSDDKDSIEVQNVIKEAYDANIKVYKRDIIADAIYESIDFDIYKAFVE